jgi:glycosyltransferase involved in cell wall biosynthesis
LRICYVGWAHSLHTIRWAQWFADRGHDVHIISHRAPRDKSEGVTIHLPKSETGESPGKLLRLLYRHPYWRVVDMFVRVIRVVGQLKPDILHIQNGLYPNFFGGLTGFHPLCFTGWDGDILWRVDTSTRQKACTRLLVGVADLVTVNSERMAEECLRMGADPGKVVKIQFPGADTRSFFKQDASHLRESLNLDDGPVILSPRSLDFEVYNTDTIVRAIPLVLKEIPAARFIFTWHSGGALEQTRALVRELGVEESVRLLGRLDYELLPAHFSLADLCVSVSSEDSCPQSMLEAMACEVPLIMSDIPALREWIKDGYNGYLVPVRDHVALANSIVSLLRDEPKRKLFAERNLRWVQKEADYDKQMAKVERLYTLLVQGIIDFREYSDFPDDRS